MASKLHGVDVDIKIIKRKGEPLTPSTYPGGFRRQQPDSLSNSNNNNNSSSSSSNIVVPMPECPTSANTLNGLPNVCKSNGNLGKCTLCFNTLDLGLARLVLLLKLNFVFY